MVSCPVSLTGVMVQNLMVTFAKLTHFLHSQRGDLSIPTVLISLQPFQRLLNTHRHPWTKNQRRRIGTLSKVLAKFP